MTNEEYLDLAHDALDALRDFIHACEPGQQLAPLQTAFTSIKNTIALADPESDLSRQRARAQSTLNSMRGGPLAHNAARNIIDEANSPNRAWRTLDHRVKLGRVLGALGENALLRCEIAERINEMHPDVRVYDNDLVGPLRDLLAAGELHREKEPRGPNHRITDKGGYRWRWRRRRELSPEMKELENRLKEA